MKRTLQFKLLSFTLMLPLFLLASNPCIKGKHTKEKKINKEFSVSPNAKLNVKNSYGNLDIITWNENKIAFEITITTTGNNEEKVQKKLDDITVEFEASANNVSAKTKFNYKKSGSWWKWNKNNNVNMKINYIIKIPITNGVNLNNDYGNITLGKLKGQAKINCDYGKITTKELMATDNDITFDYTNNCYFEYINGGNINADYSSYTIEKAKKLSIKADYTKSDIEIAETVIYNCDYGALKVQKANTITGNGDYLTLRLGDLHNTVSIDASYGSIKIDKLHESFKNLNVKSNYTDIKIGYSPNLNFDFNLDLDYAGLRGGEDFKFIKKTTKTTYKQYTGHYGNQNSGNKIAINSNYGGVSFYKN